LYDSVIITKRNTGLKTDLPTEGEKINCIHFKYQPATFVHQKAIRIVELRGTYSKVAFHLGIISECISILEISLEQRNVFPGKSIASICEIREIIKEKSGN
jgi:hypothetical protein